MSEKEQPMPRARILGFEWDASSSHARGAALGPSVVKRLLTSEASSGYSIDLTPMREAIAGYDIPGLPEDGAGARRRASRARSRRTRRRCQSAAIIR
jgi:arginase family enzyme